MRRIRAGLTIATSAAGLSLLIATGAGKPLRPPQAPATRSAFVANDSHFHLTN